MNAETKQRYTPNKCIKCGYEGSTYCYTDEQRGLKDVALCSGCMADHLERYYPQSTRLIAHARSQDERTPEQKEKSHEIQKLNRKGRRDSAAIPGETSSLDAI